MLDARLLNEADEFIDALAQAYIDNNSGRDKSPRSNLTDFEFDSSRHALLMAWKRYELPGTLEDLGRGVLERAVARYDGTAELSEHERTFQESAFEDVPVEVGTAFLAERQRKILYLIETEHHNPGGIVRQLHSAYNLGVLK